MVVICLTSVYSGKKKKGSCHACSCFPSNPTSVHQIPLRKLICKIGNEEKTCSIINQGEIYFSGQASKLSRHGVCQSTLTLAYISCSCEQKTVWVDNESKLGSTIQTNPTVLLFPLPPYRISLHWTNTCSKKTKTRFFSSTTFQPRGDSDCFPAQTCDSFQRTESFQKLM